MSDDSQIAIAPSFIALFIEPGRYKPSTSRQVIAERYEFCEDLATFPLRGTARDDIRPGLRTIGFRRRGVIAFVVWDDVVVIVGVFYGGRDYEQVLRDDAGSK